MGKRRYDKCILGGTFSLLHEGHKHLLLSAIKIAREIIIGITSEKYLEKHPKKHPVEPYDVRALNVAIFCLKNMEKNQKLTIVPIDDPWGPALELEDIDCIVVSEETFLGALHINRERRKKGLSLLDIIVVDLIPYHNSFPLSSSKLWSLE